MISLPFDPSLFTKTDFIIGGITVHVYNLDKLLEFIKKFDNVESKGKEIPIRVLYLLHGRKGSYTNTQSFGFHILERYNEQISDVPMIFVTFDLSNHGSRTIDYFKNLDWRENNETHGFDIYSIIEASVFDTKMIIDFLPTYLQLDLQFKENLDYKFKYTNILSGYSLGGHIIYRFAIQFPESVNILNPVIGCPNFSSLLLDRLLRVRSQVDSKRYLQNYNDISINGQQSRYPKSLHEKLQATDLKIFNNFPFEKPIFASLGMDDPLVPNIYSLDFLAKCQKANPNSVVFRQPGKKHDVTLEMIDGFTDWLVKELK